MLTYFAGVIALGCFFVCWPLCCYCYFLLKTHTPATRKLRITMR